MSAPIVTQIAEALRSSLQHCLTASGYTSNIGTNVNLGLAKGAYIEAPSAWILPMRQTTDEVLYGNDRVLRREFRIQAFIFKDETIAPLDTTLDVAAIDVLIYDVRRAIETRDIAQLHSSVTALTHVSDTPYYQTPGGTVLGAEVVYAISFATNLLTPSIA